MKSKYFKNLAKGLVIASAALALVNCNESTTAADEGGNEPTPIAVEDPTNPSDPTQTVTDPTQNPADPSQTVTDPAQQGSNQGTDPSQTVTDD